MFAIVSIVSFDHVVMRWNRGNPTEIEDFYTYLAIAPPAVIKNCFPFLILSDEISSISLNLPASFDQQQPEPGDRQVE